MSGNTSTGGLKEQRARRQRVNRIKTGIILFFVTWLIVCMVLNIVLMVRVSSLQKQIDMIMEKTLQGTLYGTEQTIETEQKMLDAADDNNNEAGQQADMQLNQENTADDGSESAANNGIDDNFGENDADIAASDEEWDVRNCIGSGNYRTSEDDPMVVYLTFDDGPSENTPEILRILRDHNVKATFFVTGKEGENAREWYKQIVDEGHTLAMHSYTHKYSAIYDSLDAFKADFIKLHDYLEDVTGVDSKFFRFPGGSSNQVSNTDMNELIDYLGEQGVTYYDWNVVCGDATSQIYTADEMVQNVMTDAVKFKYSVVLMHDASNKNTTVEMLETLLQKLEAMDADVLPITGESPVIHHTIS